MADTFEPSATRWAVYSPSMQCFFKKGSYGCCVLTRRVTDAKTYSTSSLAKKSGIPYAYAHEYIDIHREGWAWSDKRPLPTDFKVVPVNIVAEVS
jgi:hypothetical protein